MNLDSLGLIVAADEDGGDTAQRSGFYAIANKDDGYYCKAKKLLEPKLDGNWVRHPIQYPNPKDFSRDQTIPNIIALGLLNYKMSLYRMLKAQLKRFGLYQNGDIFTPQDIGYYIRAFKFWPLYLFLWFSDLFILINTIIICAIKARKPGKIQTWLGNHVHWIFIQGAPNNAEGIPQDVYGDNNVGTDINHMVSIYQAQTVMPTFVSFLARKMYKYFRPHGIIYPLQVYFKIDNPDFINYWTPILEKF